MNNEIIPGFYDTEIEGLQISIEKAETEDDILVLHLEGFIDTENSISFQEKVIKVIDQGYSRIIFNCTRLNYVSSTGIGSFTSFLTSIKTKGGSIVFYDLQPKVFEVFQLLGFPQFLNIVKNMDDAVAFFKKQSAGGENRIFPAIITCNSCGMKLQVAKAGKFRCTGCKSVLNVEDDGSVTTLL